MTVAITAQVPPAASSPSTDSPQATQGTGTGPGATSEQGLVDFFAKTRADVANGNLQEATNSVASSGEMLGKLREFVEKAHKSDAANKATKAKQRAAAAEANIELASLDTAWLPWQSCLSLPVQPDRSVRLIRSVCLPQSVYLRRPASRTGVRIAWSGPGLEMKGRGVAMIDKMTNDMTDSAIQRMWTQVVGHATSSVTKNVMSLLKGQ